MEGQTTKGSQQSKVVNECFYEEEVDNKRLGEGRDRGVEATVDEEEVG